LRRGGERGWGMTRIPDICRQFQNTLIVSCQAFEGEAFRDCETIGSNLCVC
jgi:putative N-acetylmannosamine-6-phosphate epimerase